VGEPDFAVMHKSFSAGRTLFTQGFETVIVDPTNFKQFLVETQNTAVRHHRAVSTRGSIATLNVQIVDQPSRIDDFGYCVIRIEQDETAASLPNLLGCGQ
jgi:hypothetical protein